MENLTLEMIDPSWLPLFEDNIEELKKIDRKLSGCDHNPDNKNIFRFAWRPISDVRVVIVGQDTYPARGVATGRAFEVGGLDSWNKPFRQVSLKNIIRLVHSVYTMSSSYESFETIKSEIKTGEFKILPPNLLFESWQQQGVILLNCALTCEVNKAGSHSEMWRSFIKEVFTYFCKKNKSASFFLWGKAAEEIKPLVDDGRTLYVSRHPMMCSVKYKDDFLKSGCFKETMDEINWLGGDRF